MRAGSARRGDGVVRPLQTQVDRQEAGNHVDDRARHEERRNAPRPLLVQRFAVVLDIGQAADAGAHGHTDTLTIGVSDVQPGITHGLEAGSETVLDEQVELARLLGGEIFLDIEALERPAKTGGVGRQVHMLDQTDATAPGQNALPAARHIVTQWRQHAHTGNHDASTRHSNLLLFYSGATCALHVKKNRTPD